jgi:hypothetical protein
MQEIPNWIVEETNDYGEPIGWRNQDIHTFIGIRYNDETEQWEVTGDNSRINTSETETDARKKAKEFMLDTPSPPGMV